MNDYQAPVTDMMFALNDVFDAPSHFAKWYPDKDLDESLIRAVLEEAGRFCREVLSPLNRPGDEHGCRFDKDSHAVTTPEGFREAYQKFVEAGWPSFTGPESAGGQGMPKALHMMIEEMLYGANTSFCLYPSLTSGAIHALHLHANPDLVDVYLEKLVSGEWSGTMCLTEPHAGSDLGLLRTKAEPDGESYRITGTKIFITGGEHDLTENIVHLVLARLPDAPEGVKGISLFLVPKYLPTSDGKIGERNQVYCSSIEHKMGIKASSTCVMNFEQARGWLIGEPNQGLKYMFSMMNNERLSIGLQGIGLAERSWQTAVRYATERLQGRSPLVNESAPHPIAAHPDVRRMLLWMHSFVEIARLSAVMVGLKYDASLHGDDEERTIASDWVAFLTPVAKAFWTDMGFAAVNLGVQVLGGHGYIREWGQEQCVRDLRIAQIYEGTNGIQAMDLIGRKVLADSGHKSKLFADWVDQILANSSASNAYRERLSAAHEQLKQITTWLIQEAQKRPALPGAVANDYLHLVGWIWFGALWLHALERLDSSSLSPNGKEKKRILAKFFFERMFPCVNGHIEAIRAGEDSMLNCPNEWFDR